MTTTATPPRTTDQRFAALARANEIRSRRAQLKVQIAARQVDLGPLILDPPDYLATARLVDMLLHVPKYGRTKTNRLMAVARVSPSKTFGGMSERQRREVVALLAQNEQERARRATLRLQDAVA